MERRRRRGGWPRPFTSAMTKRETILVLAYLPLHLYPLQLLFSQLAVKGLVTEAEANLLYYALGFMWMLAAAVRFLRRDFDALADGFFPCVREVLSGYLWMVCFNLAVSLAASLLTGQENPNNAAVMTVVVQDLPTMKAMLVYLAPFVEELLFRAGIFGTLRRKNRRAAYIVSALCFSLYHVAPYALQAPIYWVYLIQYIPVSLLLARCYERTNTIWCSIFFHMLVNYVSLSALSTLG